MSRFGPWSKAPQLVERKARLVDMMVRDQPEVNRLRFYAAGTLNAAYGNPATSGLSGAVTQVQPLFEVGASRQFRSPSVIKRAWSWYGEALKNMSRVAFDPSDYSSVFLGAGIAAPSDEDYWFIRLQERRSTTGWQEVSGAVNNGEPKLGPIYVVPQPEFFGQNIPTLILQGTAPNSTGCTAGERPALDLDMQVPNPMHIVLPRTTSSITINNLSTTETLLVSTGLGTPMTAVGPDDDPAVVFGSFKEIVIAGDGANVDFSVYAVVGLGPGL